MKLSKRVLAFLLALVMVVSLCPQTAYAAVGESQSTAEQSQSTAEQSQNTDEQTTETKMPEETPADGETAEESEITDVTSVEDKEEVLEEDTGSVKEDTKQSEQAEEEKEQEEGKEEVTEDSETSLQIAEEDVSSARTVNLEYNILTSGETLIGNTKSDNYYFKPEQSGIYYLTVENHEETQLDLNAYYKYFTKDENDVTTESDWYQEWG